ncbi:hypothetical protein F511_28482 [Dorcoceras hygrometricum]|uniref:Uncharacterized protein n=1 Tax=Dorcoceras hygrometricum TaxID=472368 RepID=A0A2Z7CUQ9_9LAMI|nr:hypothetical protein F511_28482 [Dorcoceras hygrometricum]
MVAEENKSAWADSDSEESSSETSSSSESEDEVQCLMADDTDEEVKAEKESCTIKSELVSSSDMQAALSKLATENEELKSRSQEMLYENQRLDGIIRSWTRSSAFLDKLHGSMKPNGYKSGLGYDGKDSIATLRFGVARATSSKDLCNSLTLISRWFERPADGSSADLRYATSFGLVAATPF